MDPRTFRAPFLSRERIWAAADELRDAGCSFPVNVLDLAEFDLGLEIVPADGLREKCDTEAILMGDLKTILVDKRSFLTPKQEYRLRFSVAHELGHYVLHKKVYAGIKHASPQAWLAFMSDIPEDQHSWPEFHADEFAGRLLVPFDRLRADLQEAIDVAIAAGFDIRQGDLDMLLQFIAGHLSKPFNVSGDVIMRRLRFEKLWPP